MASTKPHLLTIPREIRDEIYGYLHHQTKTCWAWREMQSQPDCWDTAVLMIHNALLLDVLLTHSRLRDE
jgi:hypothetical protein